MKIRGFEKISFEQFKKDFSNLENIEEAYDDLTLPKRSTKMAAGYDFVSPIDFILPTNKVMKLPTGIKVKMNDGEVLEIIIRSSLGFKYNVRLCNQAGIIDADYYNNVDNEGHIWLAFHNHGENDWVVKKGDRVVQGIFLKFLLIDDIEDNIKERKGGLGSTDKGDETNE